jgi:hypothetical protein
MAPLLYEPKCGGGGGGDCGVSADENSCGAHQVTWSPNNLTPYLTYGNKTQKREMIELAHLPELHFLR